MNRYSYPVAHRLRSPSVAMRRTFRLCLVEHGPHLEPLRVVHRLMGLKLQPALRHTSCTGLSQLTPSSRGPRTYPIWRNLWEPSPLPTHSVDQPSWVPVWVPWLTLTLTMWTSRNRS